MSFRIRTLARAACWRWSPAASWSPAYAVSQAAPNNVVSTPPMGWASWNTFAAQDQLQRDQGSGRRAGVVRAEGRRLPVRQHRRGLVAGHPGRGRQHHRRHRRMAGRDEGHRRLHPQQGPEGRHLHRRRPGRLRLLLPDRAAGGAGLGQRGPLRPGLPAVLPVGLRLRQGGLVRRRRRGARTRGPRTRRSATRSPGRPRRPAGRWCCRCATGATEPVGLGAGHVDHVAHQPGHHLLRREPVDGPGAGATSTRRSTRPRRARAITTTRTC